MHRQLESYHRRRKAFENYIPEEDHHSNVSEIDKKEQKQKESTILSDQKDDCVAADSWIDELSLSKKEEKPPETSSAIDISMKLLTQQRLPSIAIKNFDGAPEAWIDFISQFYDNIHSQPYLTDLQRKMYLMQHLQGEPKRALQCYGNDSYGYIQALKRLKYMFGQKTIIAQAVISKITKGRQISNNDVDGLTKYYYVISDCLHTLKRMCYYSDLYSSDVLKQAVGRLPFRLAGKWADYSFRIRKREEPTLIHFESWLQDRVMAMKDPC